jgi:hypothetical protein
MARLKNDLEPIGFDEYPFCSLVEEDKRHMKPFTREPKCPYCGIALDSAPSRKKKCPHCGEFIYVNRGVLLTEDDAKIEKWLIFLNQFGIIREDFDNYRKRLSKQFGSTTSVNDTVWGILNEFVSKSSDLHSIKMAYYEMARLAREEGKDTKPFITEALRIELKELKKQGVKTVRVVNCGNRGDDPSTCSKCKSLYGKKFDIDIAIRTLPIPTMCEEKLGCRCSYMSEQEWRYYK